MKTHKLALAFAAGALATAPVVAQAQERASAPASEQSELFGGGGATWIGILATIAVVVLAVIAATRDHNDPVSP